ncbi:MAG: hypothetical protein QOJ52_4041 [Acidimicrobiaceae bacterium]|nr:hypothetical protein [Acidimicrobiaceae bacterium]
MLVTPLILSLAAFVSAGEFRRDIPRATWEPIFFQSVNDLTHRVGWEPLRNKSVAADSLEVRVWIGFGVVPLEAFRLRRDGSQWSAQHVIDTVQKAGPANVRAASPKSGWATLWRDLTHLGLLTLPDSSALPREEEMILDGESYVVEISQNDSYRTYEYSNPQFQRWPEAKKIVQIVQTLHRELGSR